MRPSFPLPDPDNEPLGEMRDNTGNVATLVIVDERMTDGKSFQIFPTADHQSVVVGVSHTMLERVWGNSDNPEEALGLVFASVGRALTKQFDPRG